MTTETTTSQTITETHAGGMPLGSYGILYYTAASNAGAWVARQAGGDSNVTAAYVQRAADALNPLEIMVATCQSQPGGMTAYGSPRAREVWQAVQAREEREHVAELETAWTAAGAKLQVRRAAPGLVVVSINGAEKTYRPNDLAPVSGLSADVAAAWAEIRRRAERLAA